MKYFSSLFFLIRLFPLVISYRLTNEPDRFATMYHVAAETDSSFQSA